MAELINLRTVRKRAQRQKDEQRASANRLVHGEPKRVRQLEDDKQAKANRDLEAHRIERGDGR